MNIWRSAIVALTAAIALLPVPALCAPSDTSGVMATVNGAVAAFNGHDAKRWSAACDSPASIIDVFPPNAWSGPTACSDWMNAFDAFNKKSGLSWGTLNIGTAWHIAVTGSHAYTVFPATYTYRIKGKPAREAGVFTLVLTRTRPGWRIVAWSWAQH